TSESVDPECERTHRPKPTPPRQHLPCTSGLNGNDCLDQEQMAKSSRRSLNDPVGSQRDQEHRGS
ncbi:hypothetical protein LEMLEM_LOCUS18731, partial [Lemmus lemmus]